MSLFLVSEPILFFQLSIIFKGSWKACDHRHLCPSCLMNKIALSLPDVRKQGHFHFRAVMVAADLFLVQVRSELYSFLSFREVYKCMQGSARLVLKALLP